MSQDNPYLLNIEKIREFLPHRYPFLLVDRILEVHPVGDIKDLHSDDKLGVRVKGIKNFTYNEPFMQGHFPNFSIVPGVILLEAMGQVSSFSVYPYLKDRLAEVKDDFQVMLIGVDYARFRRPVTPGDTVVMHSEVTKKRGKLWGFRCTAQVDGHLVAETEFLANMVAQAEEGKK